MEIITEIHRERSKVRLVIGSENVLVPLSLFRERPLTEGDAIDLEEYDQWLTVRMYRHALDRAVAMLATRARSTHEIEAKLLQVGYRPATVEMVLYKLQRENLLDDADFARQWVEARATRKLGRSRIAQELRRKGVSSDEAEAALDTLDDDRQLEGAVALAEKAAARSRADEDPRKVRARISAMLARRGYGWEIARRAVEAALEGNDDDFE